MMFTEEYLSEEHGIIKVEEGFYLVPLCNVTTEDEFIEELGEDVRIYNKELDDLKIKNGDTICITIHGKTDEYYELYLFDCDNPTEGYISVKSNLSDDSRFYLLCELAIMYKDVKNVTFEFDGIYTEEMVNNYVLACLNP